MAGENLKFSYCGKETFVPNTKANQYFIQAKLEFVISYFHLAASDNKPSWGV